MSDRRQADIEASVTIRTQAAAEFRRWAAEARAADNDLAADDLDNLADQLERLYGPAGG